MAIIKQHMKQNAELSLQDLDTILLNIKMAHGYDFTSYAKASIQRRIQRYMNDEGLTTAGDLTDHLADNAPAAIESLLQRITVNVTEMFRDPEFYKSLRQNVLPMLASYPLINIWHAGCATGEEVFSMAILFNEAGLLQRTRIYATDINPANLEKARSGILPLAVMKEYTTNYINAGGIRDFATYYTARYENALINKNLRRNITFLPHNLVTDQGFNEFQLICCRNVMIYFNKDLQNRVVNLFYDSLAHLGYLALGTKESLLFTDMRNEFEPVDLQRKIFRRHN